MKGKRSAAAQPYLPVLPVGTAPVLPLGVGTVDLALPPDPSVLETAVSREGKAILAATGDETLPPGPDNLLPVAVLGRILSRRALPGRRIQLMVRGEHRVRLGRVVQRRTGLLARPSPCCVQPPRDQARTEQAVAKALEILEALMGLEEGLPRELEPLLRQAAKDPDAFADQAAAALDLPAPLLRGLLMAENPEARLALLVDGLEGRTQAMRNQAQLGRQTQERLDRLRRESWLRHQLTVIREQLGENEPDDATDFEKRVQASAMPPEAKAEAGRELRRLRRLPPNSSEAGVVRGWLDFLLALPWGVAAADPPPFRQVDAILDRHHFGLERIKERIREEIAVMRLNGPGRGAILCFAGPPGTGKTSLGRAIAAALGRPYYRVALGGMRDESEIRGHRRTYVGAMPGRILEGLRRVGAVDPVFLIDEVDKLGVGYQGDPAAALLEVLDPEQNRAFTDHYLGLPFDLSRVVFLATANVPDDIPPALRDRMEVIPLTGYTEEEKLAIANRFLLPRSLEASGLPAGAARASRGALLQVIRSYTREAGVRNLRRSMEKLARRLAVLRMEDPGAELQVRARDLPALLGTPSFHRGRGRQAEGVGLVHGLAWSAAGGEVLDVEAALFPGRGHEVLTGNLGQVMRESVQAALTLVRARHRRLQIRREVLQRADIHIHFPAGATPKDGPSAGVAVAVAVASAMSGRPPEPGIALTGELSLRGRVLPVGGVREKLLAAASQGFDRVILPRGNQADLEKVPAKTLKSLEVRLVDTVDQVFEIMLP